ARSDGAAGRAGVVLRLRGCAASLLDRRAYSGAGERERRDRARDAAHCFVVAFGESVFFPDQALAGDSGDGGADLDPLLAPAGTRIKAFDSPDAGGDGADRAGTLRRQEPGAPAG